MLLVVRWVIMALPLVYMAFIWFLSSQPANSVVELGVYDSFIKESLHLVEFAILYGLIVLALLVRGELKPSQNRLALLVSVAYAFLDEFHQSFIPSRSASVIDIIKDMIGIAVVWYLIKQTYYRKDCSQVGRFLRLITERLAPGADPQGSK